MKRDFIRSVGRICEAIEKDMCLAKGTLYLAHVERGTAVFAVCESRTVLGTFKVPTRGVSTSKLKTALTETLAGAVPNTATTTVPGGGADLGEEETDEGLATTTALNQDNDVGQIDQKWTKTKYLAQVDEAAEIKPLKPTIAKFKKDYQTLLKNFPKLKTKADRDKLRGGISTFKSYLNRIFFDKEGHGSPIRLAMRWIDARQKEAAGTPSAAGGVSKFGKYDQEAVAKPAWDLYLTLGEIESVLRTGPWDVDPIHLHGDYYTRDDGENLKRARERIHKDALDRLRKLKDKAYRWGLKVAKEVDDIEERLGEIHVLIAQGVQHNMSGIRIVNYGYGPNNIKALKRVARACAIVKAKAGARFPWLLKHMPFIKLLNLNSEVAGDYDARNTPDGSIIRISSYWESKPEALAEVIIHEAAHHVWRQNAISGEAKKKWIAVFRGPERDAIFTSDYSKTQPEEAFTEIIANIVMYGRQKVPAKGYKLLKHVLGSNLKEAVEPTEEAPDVPNTRLFVYDPELVDPQIRLELFGEDVPFEIAQMDDFVLANHIDPVTAEPTLTVHMDKGSKVVGLILTLTKDQINVADHHMDKYARIIYPVAGKQVFVYFMRQAPAPAPAPVVETYERPIAATFGPKTDVVFEAKTAGPVSFATYEQMGSMQGFDGGTAEPPTTNPLGGGTTASTENLAGADGDLTKGVTPPMPGATGMNFSSGTVRESLTDEETRPLCKAIFMAGGPASGKSTAAEQMFLIQSHKDQLPTATRGVRIVNTDEMFELVAKNPDLQKEFAGLKDIPKRVYNLKPADMGGDMDSREVQRNLFPVARALMKRLAKGFFGMRQPVLIDGTGRHFETIQKQREYLKSLGYDCYMVMCRVDYDVAIQRNRSRARTVPEEFMQKAHDQINGNREKYVRLFGNRYYEVESGKTPYEELRALGDEILNAPLHNRDGKEWLTLHSLIQHQVQEAILEKLGESQGPRGSRKYNAAVAVILHEGDVLLGLAKADDDRDGKLCFPGGGIDKQDGGDPLLAARREAFEEAGVNIIPHSILEHPDKPGVAFVVSTYSSGQPEPNEEFTTLQWVPIDAAKEDFPNVYPENRHILWRLSPGLKH